MKIRVNTTETIRANAEKHINLKYMVVGHYMAHHRKRQLAESVLAGQPATPEFEDAAKIEGVTASELASSIVSKPDELMQHENNRRSMIKRIRAANSAAELQTILTDIDISVAAPGVPLGWSR